MRGSRNLLRRALSLILLPFFPSKLLSLIEKLSRKHSIIKNSHELKSKTPLDFRYNQNDSNQVGETNENEQLLLCNNRLFFIREIIRKYHPRIDNVIISGIA